MTALHSEGRPNPIRTNASEFETNSIFQVQKTTKTTINNLTAK